MEWYKMPLMNYLQKPVTILKLEGNTRMEILHRYALLWYIKFQERSVNL